MNIQTKAVLTAISAILLVTLMACGASESNTMDEEIAMTHEEIAIKVLTEGLVQQNTDVVNELVSENYIQHSALAQDGRQGLLDFINNGPKLDMEIHRVLTDGDKVALHNTYTFPDGSQMVAFDVFRIENGKLAEHWDALQANVPAGETVSGRSMVDGTTQVTDLDKTEANRAIAIEFADAILTKGQFDRLTEFVSTETYDQHNPLVGDGLDGLGAFVQSLGEQGLAFGYTRSPLVVAQGNFVLIGSEGFFGPADVKPFAVFYDLFRIENGKIVEHWDVIPTPAPDPTNLPHTNGLF